MVLTLKFCSDLPVQTLAQTLTHAFFFKFTLLSWMILCAISQSTYFAVSYSGRLDRMLNDIKLGAKCAKYSRLIAVIYTSIAWVIFLINSAFLVYSLLFTGGYMDLALAPISTHVSVSNPVIPQIVFNADSHFNTCQCIQSRDSSNCI